MASVSGNPFIIDTSDNRCPVLFAEHGTGSWSPVPIASSMQTFIKCLAQFEDALLGDFDLDVWNNEGLRPEFVADVAEKVAGILSKEEARNFLTILE